jgi:hypothetical protein
VNDGVIRPTSDINSLSDIVQIYEYTEAQSSIDTGITNPAPSKSFFFFDNGAGSNGWFIIGNFAAGEQSDYELPYGAAIVIRRVEGVDAALTWTPPLPYSL